WPTAEHAKRACRLLLGRLKPLPRMAGLGQSRPFVGRMDELALYNHILTPEEVQHHYDLGVHGGRSRTP
ncbi:LamG-like jellyroll fold domain-containing protein, partial [Singulisphaera rosea]